MVPEPQRHWPSLPPTAPSNGEARRQWLITQQVSYSVIHVL